MLPTPNLIVVTAFTGMGIGFIPSVIRSVGRSLSLWGKPSIQPVLFYLAKISMFLCWAFLLAGAILPAIGSEQVPSWMLWTGALLFSAGASILVIAINNLGSSLRYGLPEEGTMLMTTGIYRFSRHPLYLGVFITMISSSLFYPQTLNIFMAAICISLHYPIILAEERFLAGRFGGEWESYKSRVRRFL